MTDTAAAPFTPGPWQAFSGIHGWGVAADPSMIADDLGWNDEGEANAHLIAAAPAMLAALEVFYDMSGCDCDSAYLGEEWVAPEHASDCLVYQRYIAQKAAARAAIAQARGER